MLKSNQVDESKENSKSWPKLTYSPSLIRSSNQQVSLDFDSVTNDPDLAKLRNDRNNFRKDLAAPWAKLACHERGADIATSIGRNGVVDGIDILHTDVFSRVAALVRVGAVLLEVFEVGGLHFRGDLADRSHTSKVCHAGLEPWKNCCRIDGAG